MHWGASSPRELIEHASELGYDTVALTDRDSVAGIVPFSKAALEAGIKPIVGCELTNPDDVNQSVVLLARNRQGYQLICRLITARHLDEEFNYLDSLRNIDDNIILLVPHPALLNEIATYIPPSTLFAEIVASEDKSILARNYHLARDAERLRIKTVLTCSAYGAKSESHELHKILRAIGLLSSINRLKPDEYMPTDCYLKSESELSRWRERFPGSIERTREIAEMCDFAPSFSGWVFPEFRIPDNAITDRMSMLQKEMNTHEYLSHIAHDGLRRRMQNPGTEYMRRLRYELEIIEQLGFSSYFLTVWELVQMASERGIPTIGRGSAANSLVSYSLYLTHVDPIKYDLYFERFLNPGRNVPPDIDIDFSWKRRDEIIDWVYERHGRDRVAMISTHCTFRMRSALREVAKALGLPESEINPVTKNIPWTWNGDMKSFKENYPGLRNASLSEGVWQEIRRIAVRLQGFPQHLSIHCGGIVITPDPITNHVPLQRSGFTGKGLAVTQFEMHAVEEIGLVKIDLLGNRSLGVFTDLTQKLKDESRDVDIENFEMIFADKPTIDLIRNGNTIGCFYIESPAMRSLLKKLHVDDFEGLTAASSVIRPGVAESGMMDEYIARHNDPSKTKYLHPKMEELLSRTYGVMIYQEDVIKVAHHVAGMSLADADMLRRAMSGKARGRKTMEEFETDFINSCSERNIEPEIASEIWRQIASFAGYSFCKGHSASFAMLSFQMAYLKTHYPAEFMAAVMSNFGGFYGFGAYMQEARRLGVKILAPDINESEYLHIGHDGSIRLGFYIVKNLEQRTIERIVDERTNPRADAWGACPGAFPNLYDFMHRVEPHPSQLKILIECGACDSLDLPRPQLLMQSELRTVTRTPTVREGIRTPSVSAGILSSSDCNLFPHHNPSPIVITTSDYTSEKLLDLELKHFGRLISRHPLELFTDQIKRLKAIPSNRMHKYAKRRVTMVGWMIARKTVTTRSEKLMQFLSMEDLDGTFEVTLFPKAYEKHAWKTSSHGPYIIRGKIELHFGVPALDCDEIKVLEKTVEKNKSKISPPLQ